MNTTPFFRAFWLILSLTLISETRSQLWQQTSGPGGDHTTGIAVNSQGHIFVLSRGLHRSVDNGSTWQRIFPIAPIWSIKQIVVQPSGRLLISLELTDTTGGASLPSNGIYASDDDGDTWTRVPINATKFWQGASGMLFAKETDKLKRSLDNGDSWQVLSTPGVTGNIISASSNQSGDLLICANFLYRSTDQGASWSKIVNGITTTPEMVVNAPDGDLFAFNNRYEVLYRSKDGGRTWVTVKASTKSMYIYSMVFNNSNDILILCNNSRLIIHSSDNGSTWKQLPIGADVDDIGYPPLGASEPSGAFILTIDDFVSRFDPNSFTYEGLAVPNGNVVALTSHPNDAIITFFQTSNYEPYLEYNHIYVSTSTVQGASWKPGNLSGAINNNDYVANYLTSVATDSTHNILGGTNGYIIVSSDAGDSWKLVPPRLTTGQIVGLAVRHSGEIFATSSKEGIFRSTDNGVTWDQLNSGISDQKLSSVAVHQNGDVYAGGNKVIYKSINNGLTWQLLTTNFPPTAGNVTAMVVSTQGNIIAGVENAGVFWSTDNGNTWSERAQGLTAKKIHALLSTPVGKVFAGTDEGVFYLDTVAGAQWVQYSGGITAKNVLSLCRDASGRIYAGTDASGVFRSIETFNIIAPSEVRQLDNAATITSIGTNYPNPFRNSTTIPFSLGEDGQVRLEILDALGRHVALLGEGTYSRGAYEMTFNANEHPAGTYFIRLQTSKESITRAIVLEK